MKKHNTRLDEIEKSLSPGNVVKNDLSWGEKREAVLQRLTDETTAILAGEPMTKKPYEGTQIPEYRRRILDKLAKL